MSTDLVKDLGLPIALVLFATIFFWKGLWPWMTKQVAISQEQSKDAIAALAGLKDALIQHAEIGRQTVDLLKELKNDARTKSS